MSRLAPAMLTLLLVPILAAPAAAQKWVNISYPWSFVEHHAAAEMIDDTTDSFVFGTERRSGRRSARSAPPTPPATPGRS